MGIDLTKETKNLTPLTLESKGSPTWDNDPNTWDGSGAQTWDQPGEVITLEQKNVTGLTLENKNA